MTTIKTAEQVETAQGVYLEHGIHVKYQGNYVCQTCDGYFEGVEAFTEHRWLATVEAIDALRGAGLLAEDGSEPSEEQVEAAAKALRDDKANRTDTYRVPEWEDMPYGDKLVYRGQARAALTAAQGAAPQAPVLNPDDMSVMNGYLVLSVNEHTCGTGPDGHYGAHEPGCGYEPLVNLAEIPGYPADAAAAMDRVNRLHQTVLRGNSMLGEELEAWCVHCNIPAPCHTMQALGPVLPSSGVDEDKLAKAWHEGFCRGEASGAREVPMNPDEWNPYRGNIGGHELPETVIAMTDGTGNEGALHEC